MRTIRVLWLVTVCIQLSFGQAVSEGKTQKKKTPFEFFEPTIIATGISPYFVVAADFNHDGFLDLATSNTVSHDITVFINNGDGTFKEGVSYPTHGFTPYALAAGDINGDGYPDLVCGNLFSVNIAIFVNNGDGTFQDAINIPTGPGPMFTVLADFNNDGKLDIATSNIGHDDITVLLNQGNLKFKAVGPFKTGGVIPYSMVAADFDKDGKIDLATGNIYSGNISVLRNLGDGQFGPAEIYKTDSLTQILWAADFNNDGYPDLISGNGGSDDVSVLLNDGHGKFKPAVNYFVKLPQGVTGGDVDKDGFLDIATANQSANTTSILINNGDGTFSHSVDYPVGGLYPISVVLADLNNDGKLDLVTANSGSANISIFLNGIHVPAVKEITPSVGSTITLKSGNLLTPITLKFNTELREETLNSKTVQLIGSQSGTHSVKLSYEPATNSLKVTPLSPGENCPEYCHFQPGEKLTLRLNGELVKSAKGLKMKTGFDAAFFVEHEIAAKGGKLSLHEVAVEEERTISEIITADLDGDGKTDLIGLDRNGDGISVYYGTATGIPANPLRLHNHGAAPAQALVADFDGDGRPDIAVISRMVPEVSVSFNQGHRQFSEPVTFTLPAVASSMIALDARGTGRPDLLMASAQGKKLLLLRNAGNKQFNLAKDISVEFPPTAIAGGDVDGDGVEDVIVASPDSDKVTVYRNDGHALLLKKDELSLKSGSYPSSILVRDINLDGSPDIIVVDKLAHEIAVSLNNGDGTFRTPVYEKVEGEPEQVIVADVDHDDWPDLVVRHSFGFTVFLNQRGARFVSSTFLPLVNTGAAVLGDFAGTGNLQIATRTGPGKLTFLTDQEGHYPLANSAR